MADLTYQDVLGILRLIDAAPFSDIEVEFEGTRIKVSRRAGWTTPPPATSRRGPTSPEGEPAAALPIPAPALASRAFGGASPIADIPGGVEVKPPMEGTFYAAPSPGAPPFVEVGSRVRKGDQIGIVEVMKLFTPVSSPCDGTVRAILVANEQVVAKDQTIIVVEADG